MSQYFRPRRATTSSASGCLGLPLTPSNYRHGNDGSEDVALDSSNQIASSAILIFPNPPSDQESLRTVSESGCEFSGSSPLSLPTDVSYSIDSVGTTSRSRSRSEHEREHSGSASWQTMLHALPRDRKWDEFVPEEQSEWELESGYLKQENPRFTRHSSRRCHTRASSGLSSPQTLPSSLSPQPPFRLPFLSFLQAFLTFDESTLHLISRSPDLHVPSLFPVSPDPHSFPNSVNDDAEDGDDEPPHGTLKLLLSNPDKPHGAALLKARIDPTEIPGNDNPLLMSPGRIPVWRLLEFVIEGGVRAWKEVRSWNAGDPRLMGV